MGLVVGAASRSLGAFVHERFSQANYSSKSVPNPAGMRGKHACWWDFWAGLLWLGVASHFLTWCLEDCCTMEATAGFLLFATKKAKIRPFKLVFCENWSCVGKNCAIKNPESS